MARYAVQVGRYKGAYKNRYSFDNLSQAYMWYSGLNIWNGYKKRLIDTETKKVIERYIS